LVVKNLYEKVADRISGLILEGTLKSGDRLPSVRKLHKQLSVSISTVLEAYRLLEDKGLIVARPQSGYYVKQSLPIASEEPKLSAPPLAISTVDTSLVARVYGDISKPDVVKLGAAIPSPEILPVTALNRLMGKVIRDRASIVHSYHTPEGCQSLRQEIAKRAIDIGCYLNPDSIIITNGTTEAVYLALKSVTKPGDTVAIESPSYYGFLQALESLHLKALELPTDPKYGISLEHLATALDRGGIAACALVSNFSNPLGSCMSDAKKRSLVKLLDRHNIPLIEDDIYGDLYFTENRPKAIKAFDTRGRVLYCTSVSKILSPGLRVGWIIPGYYQTEVKRLKMVLNLTTAIVPQLTIAAFFNNGGYDRHLRKMRQTYRLQMDRIRAAICNYFPPQTKITRPQGGQVLWVELPGTIDVMNLYDRALEYQISIAPGIIFSPSKSYNNCFRINCGIPWSEEIDRAIQILGALSQQQLAEKVLNYKIN